jgi:hypothetical protein
VTTPTRPGRRHNWPHAKELYVEGRDNAEGVREFPTLKVVSEELGVPYNRLRDRSGSEGWTEERAAFQANLEKERQRRRIKELADDAVELDKGALVASKMGMRLVQARLGEVAHVAQARSAAGRIQDDEERRRALYRAGELDAREMDTLARAAQGWHALAMRALGEPETIRTELVGAGGGPLEVRSDVRAELVRDDPERLHGFIVALERSHVAAGHGVRVLAGGDPADAEGQEA